MNLVQIGTNEFFPNSPLFNSRKPSTATKEIVLGESSFFTSYQTAFREAP